MGELNRVPLAFLRQDDLAALECVREDLTILSVHQHDALRIAPFDEPHEIVMARVRAEVELLPFALDVHGDAVEIDHAFVHEAPSVRALDLVACQQDRTPRVLSDLLQVNRVHLLPHPVEPDIVAHLGEREEDVLGAADRERGDEGEPAPVDDLVDLLEERVLGLEALRMLAARVPVKSVS